MQVFKFILLIMVFISSSYIGIIISKKYSKRTEELKQIKTAINMLEAKIKFTYEPLPEIFDQISKTLSTNIANIFIESKNKMKTGSVKEAWCSSVDDSILSINSEDKTVIKDLGNLLRSNRYRRTN